VRLPTACSLTLLPAFLAGCVFPRPPRVAPASAAAIAGARAEIATAVRNGDLEAFVRHLAPDARMIIEGDTVDLRSLAVTFRAHLAGDSITSFWVAGPRLSACDRWLYETGGELGLNVAVRGTDREQRWHYLYSVAWVPDSLGNPMVQTLVLAELQPGPKIWGCRPTARDRFAPRRLGLAVQPGSGLAISTTASGIASALHGHFGTRLNALPGFERRPVMLPVFGAAWYRLTSRFSVEAVASFSMVSQATGAGDSLRGVAVAMRLDQKWAAVLASVRLWDMHLGAGPAAVREAWHVASDSIRIDARGVQATSLSDAGSTLNTIGLYAQGRMTEALSGRLFAEVRAWLLLVPSSTSPPGYLAPSIRASSANSGIGLFLGVGL